MNQKIILLLLLLYSFKNLQGQEVFPLYQDHIPGCKIKLNKQELPTLQVFLPSKDMASGTSVIIFPGGAYSFLAYEQEGLSIAKSFVMKGVTAFVLKYRLPNSNRMEDKSIGPLMDAQEAIKTVRENFKRWNLDPNKIGVVGYSAGGHLAATLGTHFKESHIYNNRNTSLRPDFMILVYPLISMEDSITHIGSKASLIGLDANQMKVDEFSAEKQVSDETPPTYITHAGDDQIVSVNNSILFYQALQHHKVSTELHIFPKGNHGFTQKLSVEEWLDPMMTFLKRERFCK